MQKGQGRRESLSSVCSRTREHKSKEKGDGAKWRRKGEEEGSERKREGGTISSPHTCMNARERGEPFKLIVYKLHNFFFIYHRPSLETVTAVKWLEKRFLLELLYGLNISLFCSWTIIVTAIHFGVGWIQLDEWRRGRECEEDCAEAVRRLQLHMGEDIIQPIMGSLLRSYPSSLFYINQHNLSSLLMQF